METPGLVLHADDLGMNRAISDGIIQAFREGVLTSTSLLSNAPDTDRAIQLWKQLETDRYSGALPSAAARARLGEPDRPFDLGVHLNLTQGRPLCPARYPAELLDGRGCFVGPFALLARLACGRGKFSEPLRHELQQQLQYICDHGLRPTHVNGHQYVEMMPGMCAVIAELLGSFDIRIVRVAREAEIWRTTLISRRPWQWPMACVKQAFAARLHRNVESRGIAHTDVFFGANSAGKLNLKLLRCFLHIARDKHLVEIGLHPGVTSAFESPQAVADGWHDPINAWRPRELQLLLSAEFVELIASTGRRLSRLAQIQQ